MAVKDYVIELEARLGKSTGIIKDVQELQKNLKIDIDLKSDKLTKVVEKVKADAYTLVTLTKKLNDVGEEVYATQQISYNMEKKISDEKRNQIKALKEEVKLRTYQEKQMSIEAQQKSKAGQDYWNKASGINLGGVETDAKKRFEYEQNWINQLTKQEEKLARQRYKANKDNLMSWDNISNSMKTAVVRSVEWGLSMGAIYGTLNKIRDVIATVVDLNTQMTNVRMITGASPEEAQDMLKTYQDIARETSLLTSEVVTSADEFLRQGRSVEETNQLIKASSVFSKVAFLDSAQSAELLTSAINGYQLSASEAMSVVDKMSAIDMAAATSSEELATAMARTANSARLAGVDMDTLLGYIGTVSSVTRGSAESIGNSFKAIFARMQSVRAGALFDEEGESISKVDEVLQQYNIHLRDANGTFRDTSDVIDELGNRWKSFENTQQSEIATAIAGTLQRERFLTLMENYPQAMELAEVSMNSAGSAMEKFEIAQESIANKLKELRNEFEIFSTNVLSGDFVAGIVDAGLALAKFANTYVGQTMIKMTALISTFALLNKAFSVFSTAMMSKSWVNSLMLSFNLISTGAVSLSGAFQVLTATMMASPLFMPIAIIAGISALVGVNNLLTTTLKEQTAIVQGHKNALSQMTSEYDALMAKGELTDVEDARLRMLQLEISATKELLRVEAEKQYVMGKAKGSQGLKIDSSQADTLKGMVQQYQSLSNEVGKTAKKEYERVLALAELKKSMAVNVQELLSLKESGVQLTAQDEKLIATVEKLSQVQDAQSNTVAEVSNAYANSQTAMNDYIAELEYLEEVEKSVRDEGSLSLEQKDEFLAKYPELKDTIIRTSEGWTIEASALEMLRGQALKTANDKISAERADLANRKASLMAKLKLDQAEIQSAQAVTNAMYARAKANPNFRGSSQGFGSPEQSELVNLFGQIAEIDKIMANAGGISAGGISGGKAPTAKKEKESKDTWKEAFDEQYKALQHQLTMNEISEAKYLDSLEVLYKKYFANRTKYLDEFNQYEEEVYTKRKKIEEEALKESLEREKEKIQSQKDALDSLIDAVSNLIKYEKNQEKDYYGSLIEQEKNKHDTIIENLNDEVKAKKEALNKELDGYKRIIDAQLESLKIKQQERSYQQDLSEKQKQLATLEAELVELGFDDSAEGGAKRLQLQEQISAQKLEIENTQYDKGVELAENALNKEYERYEENINKQLDEYDSYLDKEEKRYEKSLDNRIDDYQSYIDNIDNFLSKEGLLRQEANRRIETGGQALFQSLLAYNAEYGTNSQEVMQTMWDTATGAMTGYQQKQLSVLDTLRILSSEMNRVTDALGGKSVSQSGTSAKAKEQLNQQKYLHDMMVKAKAENNTGLIKWIESQRSQWGLNPKTGAIVDQYHTGGIVSDSPKLKTTETMAKLLKGELVSTEPQIEKFMKITLPTMIGMNGVAQSGGITISMPMTFEGNVDESVLPDLKNFVKHTVDTAIGQLNNAMKQKGQVRNARAISI